MVLVVSDYADPTLGDCSRSHFSVFSCTFPGVSLTTPTRVGGCSEDHAPLSLNSEIIRISLH